MRRATFFTGVAVVIGIFAVNAFAGDLHSRTSFDGRTNIVTVGHPGSYPRHDSYNRPWHPRHGYSHHPYGVPPHMLRVPLYGPPAVIYPYPGYPPVYPRHICGPDCGCGYGYGHPSNFYYRGNGWGFSFGF